MAKVYISGSVKTVRALYGSHLKLVIQKTNIESWLREVIDILWEGYKIADRKVVIELTNYHPPLIGMDEETVFATNITYEDIEAVVMEEYGFMSWQDVKEAGSFNPGFELAVNVALTGDVDTMQKLLRKSPELVNEASSFGHRASIVQYLAANGVEIWRQYISEHILEMLELLIEFGADPDAENHIYGGSTLRSLIETSDHTFKSGKADELLEHLNIYGY